MYVDGKRGQQVHHHSFPPPEGTREITGGLWPTGGALKSCWKVIFLSLSISKVTFSSVDTVCMRAKPLQLCLTLCDSVDCSPPGSSVRGILQVRILEWVAMPSSRGSPWPRDGTCVSNGSCWATGEAGYGLGIEEQHYTLGYLRPILEFQACGCPARHPQSGLGYAVSAVPRPAPGWRRQVL